MLLRHLYLTEVDFPEVTNQKGIQKCKDINTQFTKPVRDKKKKPCRKTIFSSLLSKPVRDKKKKSLQKNDFLFSPVQTTLSKQGIYRGRFSID